MLTLFPDVTKLLLTVNMVAASMFLLYVPPVASKSTLASVHEPVMAFNPWKHTVAPPEANVPLVYMKFVLMVTKFKNVTVPLEAIVKLGSPELKIVPDPVMVCDAPLRFMMVDPLPLPLGLLLRQEMFPDTFIWPVLIIMVLLPVMMKFVVVSVFDMVKVRPPLLASNCKL